MNHHDAWVVKNMWNQGASCGDIAYVLECGESTVRRCIDRDFKPTEGKQRIADRQERFAPLGTGCYRARITTRDGVQSASQSLGEDYSPTEASAIAAEEIESRLSEEIDSLTVERFIHLTCSY